MVFEKSSNNFIFHYLSCDFYYASRAKHLFSFMANYCNVLVRETNRTIVPWSMISIEPTVNFAECFQEVKSGKFSNVSTSSELLSSILCSVFIGQDKTTANSGKCCWCMVCVWLAHQIYCLST